MKKIIKRFLMAAGILCTLVVGGLVIETATAQQPYFFTLVVRTFLDVRGKAVITDSLRVIGTTTLQGQVVQTGALSSADSLAITGVQKNGGATSDGSSSSYFKALGSRLYQAIFLSTTNVLRLGIDTAGAIKASTWLSDTGAFVGVNTQIGLYVPGATATDKYVASPRFQAITLPVAGDLLACWPKADSVVITRPASGTSGLKFTVIRMK